MAHSSVSEYNDARAAVWRGAGHGWKMAESLAVIIRRERIKEKFGAAALCTCRRGGMKVAARSGERLRREIGRGRLPRVGDG